MPVSKTQLWAIGATIIVGGFAGKQYLWKKVEFDVQSRIQAEHKKAVFQLDKAHERAKRYSIDSATDTDKDTK